MEWLVTDSFCIQGDVIAGVSIFKQSLSQRLVTAQEEYLQQKDILDRKEDLLTEKQDELNALQVKLQKCEQSYKTEKSAGNERLQQITAESAAIITEVNRCRTQMVQILNESVVRVEKSSREAEIVIQKLRADRDALQNHILASLDALTNHKVYIQDALEVLKQYHQTVQQSLSSN
jgi:SMC interacting uncharacterized protein involved in chromosome segregation